MTAAPRRRAVLVVVCASALVAGVNVSVVNVVLGDLAGDLHATTADLQWVVNAYSLTYGVLLLTAAVLGERFGRARLFRYGLALAGAAALVAAWSPDVHTLMAARGLMGTASAAVTPMGMALLTEVFPAPADRARAFGAWVGVASLGLALGPIIGGVLLQQFGWRAVFLVNVPVLAVLLVAAWWCLPAGRGVATTRFDVPGVVLSTLGLGAIVWSIIEAPDLGWASPAIVGGLGLGLVLLVAFTRWELRAPYAMVELAYLRDRMVAVPTVAFTSSSFTLAGTMLITAILFRSVYGYGPLQTGLALSPLALAILAGSAMSARATERLGIAGALGGGLALVAASAVLMAVTADAGAAGVLAATVVLGLGHGVASAPATVAVVSGFPPDKAGLGSGLSNMARQGGILLGVAVQGSILSSVFRSRLARSTGALGVDATTLGRAKDSVAGAFGVARGVGGADGRALTRAATDAFVQGLRATAICAALLSGLGSLLALRLLPARAASPEPAPLDRIPVP